MRWEERAAVATQSFQSESERRCASSRPLATFPPPFELNILSLLCRRVYIVPQREQTSAVSFVERQSHLNGDEVLLAQTREFFFLFLC